MTQLHFTGFIKGVTYITHLAENLTKVDLSGFDVNTVAPYV